MSIDLIRKYLIGKTVRYTNIKRKLIILKVFPCPTVTNCIFKKDHSCLGYTFILIDTDRFIPLKGCAIESRIHYKTLRKVKNELSKEAKMRTLSHRGTNKESKGT